MNDLRRPTLLQPGPATRREAGLRGLLLLGAAMASLLGGAVQAQVSDPDAPIPTQAPPPAEAAPPTAPTPTPPAEAAPPAPSGTAPTPPADQAPAPVPPAAAAGQSAPPPSAQTTPATQAPDAPPPAAPDAAPGGGAAQPPASVAPTASDQPAPAPASPPAAPATASDSGVLQVQPLAKLDLFSTGRETGLGQDIWKGSSADVAREVIPTLATRPLSPAGLSLARRLLAQTATAPDGAGSDADLAAARARALLALGEASLAGALLDHTPGLADNAALSQTAAEAALILGQEDKACAVGDALATDRDGIYWLRLRAYCQLVAGKTDAAQLTFTLATQQGKDAVFARLMGAAVNGAGNPGPASLRNGLELALSRRLKLDLTPALPDAAPAIAAKLADDNAGTAAPLGVLAEADLVAQLRAAKSLAAFVAVAKANKPSVAALAQAKSPTDPLLEAGAALAAGDIDTARALRATIGAGGAPAVSRDDLAILDAALDAAAGNADAPAIERLGQAAAQDDARARPRSQAATAIFAALGGPLSDDLRGQFLSFDLGRSEASAARLLALQDAAASGRAGETALIALSIAQAGGGAGPPPGDRAQIVRDLAQVGLKADAQAFAVEGLLGLVIRP